MTLTPFRINTYEKHRGEGVDLFWRPRHHMHHAATLSPPPSTSCAYFPSPRGYHFFPPFDFQLCVSVPSPAPTWSGWQIPCSQQFAASCRLFALFSALPVLCFQCFADSFAKTPGVGVPPHRSPLESATSSLFFRTPLQRLQLAFPRTWRDF